MRSAGGMRSCPIADNHHPGGPTLRASLGDQAPTGKALVIRMRGDDYETTLPETFIQRGKREGMRG
jgi:hypothetical protein